MLIKGPYSARNIPAKSNLYVAAIIKHRTLDVIENLNILGEKNIFGRKEEILISFLFMGDHAFLLKFYPA